MEFKVKGQAGAEARVALKLTPHNIGTVIIGEPPNHTIFTPSSEFQKVGTFPCTVKLVLLFNTRPWKFELQQEGGTLFSTTNEQQGLETKTLLTPDITRISLVFEV
jgi:hypothetical protein